MHKPKRAAMKIHIPALRTYTFSSMACACAHLHPYLAHVHISYHTLLFR